MPQEWKDQVESIKKSLRKSHPDMPEKRIDSIAYGTATRDYIKKHGISPFKAAGETK